MSHAIAWCGGIYLVCAVLLLLGVFAGPLRRLPHPTPSLAG